MTLQSARRGNALLLVLAAIFLLLRFVHMDADYPRNIRWDDGISTDEGWYASSAVNAHTWGVQRLPGDMNIPVLMPVWPAIAMVAFKAGGFNIITLRAADCLFFFACLALICRLLRRYGARTFIPLFLAIMAVNPWAFAFSRSGFLEFPMLTFVLLAAVLCAGTVNEERSASSTLFRLLGAGIVFGIAMLLKTTAVALMPVLLSLVCLQTDWNFRRVVRDVAALWCGTALLYAPYWLVVIRPHMEDVIFYLSVVKNTLRLTPMGFLADASRPFRYGLGSDHLLFLFALAIVPATLLSARLRTLWKDPLYVFSAVWLISFLGFMVKHNNDPARYFAVTISACALVFLALLRHIESVCARRILLLLLSLDMAVNALQISTSMLHPRYSFRDASHAIGFIVGAEPSHSPVLIGDEAHEVVLQNGLKPVNLLFHSGTITQQMNLYHPGWWLQFSPIEDGRCFREVLSHAYTAERKGDWEIFYPGQHLTLWKLTPIPGALLPATLSAEQTAACAPPVYN